MHVEVLKGLSGTVYSGEASRVIVRDRFGSVISVTVMYNDREYFSSCVGCPDFELVLKNLGLPPTQVRHLNLGQD